MPPRSWMRAIPPKKKEIDYDKISFVGKPDFWPAVDEFIRYNSQYVAAWNANDVKFMEWIVRMFPTPTQYCLPDVRALIGIASCRHSILVSGEIYVTFEEKEEMLRKEFEEKYRRGEYNTPVRCVVVPETNESMGDAVTRMWRNEKRDMMEKKHEFMLKQHEEDLARRARGRDIERMLTLDQLMHQVSSAVRGHWLSYARSDVFECIPNEGLMDKLNHLGNKSEGVQQGAYISCSPEPWLPLMTHAITHLYLEYSLVNQFPNVSAPRLSDSKFREWVVHCYSMDIPQEVCKQIREDLCNFYMPAGAKTYCSRFLKRSTMPADAIMQHSIGTNATSEMLAAVDDEIKIKQIASDPSHAMYDVIAMSAVAWYTQQLNSIEFDVDIMFCNADLIQCYKTLLMTEIIGRPRGPLIVYINGWKVNHKQTWHCTTSFAQSWMLWLKLTVDHHNSTTSHYCDISELVTAMM